MTIRGSRLAMAIKRKGRPMQDFSECRFVLVAAFAGAVVIAFPRAGAAQEADAQVDVQATTGQPLGVGKMVVRFVPGRKPALVRGQSPWLGDREGRIVYPVYRDAVTLPPGGDEKQPPGSVTAYFLFRGDRALQLDLDVGQGRYHSAGIVVNNPAAHKMLLAEWWQAYSSMVQAGATADAYPPQIEN